MSGLLYLGDLYLDYLSSWAREDIMNLSQKCPLSAHFKYYSALLSIFLLSLLPLQNLHGKLWNVNSQINIFHMIHKIIFNFNIITKSKNNSICKLHIHTSPRMSILQIIMIIPIVLKSSLVKLQLIPFSLGWNLCLLFIQIFNKIDCYLDFR